jgi:hypothetical protein
MTVTDEVTIYWAPAVFPGDFDETSTAKVDLSAGGHLVYPTPKTLRSELMKEKNPNRGPTTFLSCPAAVASFDRTVVFRNNISCSYEYDLSDDNNLYMVSNDSRYLNFTIRRPPAILDMPTIEFQLRYIFFSEESLEAVITPPMFHPPKYTQYATAVPGQYDIGRWFRPFVFEVQAWKPTGSIVFEKDEPLFYASFNTDKKIILKRFEFTKKLGEYAKSCTTFYANEPSLEKRYEVFDSANMREHILTEIKKNLLN